VSNSRWDRQRRIYLDALGFVDPLPEDIYPAKLALRVIASSRRVVSVYADATGDRAEIRWIEGDPESFFAGGPLDDEARAAFPFDLAVSLRDLTEAAILGLSYADGSRGLSTHGITYEFLTELTDHGLACGQVYQPEAGSPTRTLVEVGEALFDYAVLPEADRGDAEVRIREVVAQAEEYFEKTKGE
jgi:hypothetical protein